MQISIYSWIVHVHNTGLMSKFSFLIMYVVYHTFCGFGYPNQPFPTKEQGVNELTFNTNGPKLTPWPFW